MANYQALKTAIQQVIKTNGNKEITGALLQQSLLSMINSLGAGYQFMGVATPSTNPGTPDQNVFYIATTPGVYSNFSSAQLNSGDVSLLVWNGSWSNNKVDLTTRTEFADLYGKIFGIDLTDFQLNTYINNNGIVVNPTNGWVYYPKFDIVPGDRIVFETNTDYFIYIIATFDSNGIFIRNIQRSRGFKDFTYEDLHTLEPNATAVALDIWDYQSSSPLTQQDIADFKLKKIGATAIEGQIKAINERLLPIETNVGLNTTAIDILSKKVGEKELFFELNKLCNNSGKITQVDGWIYSPAMPITPNTQYVFNEDNELGYFLWWAIAFDSNGTYLGYRELGSAYNSKKYVYDSNEMIAAYPTAAKIAFNIWGGTVHAALTQQDIADFKLVGVVDGSIIGEIRALDSRVAALETGKVGKNSIHIDLTPGQLSYIKSSFDSTRDIKTAFKISRPVGFTGNPDFNFESVALVNKTSQAETIVHSCADDITPSQFNNSYIGGNHGNSDLRIITANNHGKTAVDIGSVWSDGQHQCTLVGIGDNNKLWFFGENNLTYPKYTFNTSMFASGVTLTHVSGATHTGNIAISQVEASQYYPAIKIKDAQVIADGKTINASGDYSCDHLDICEIYDVLNVASIINRIRALVGTFTENPVPSQLTNVDTVVRHSIIYGFDNGGEWRITINYTILQDINFSYYGFTQQGVMSGSNIRMYIPKALPISNGQTTLDFRTIVAHNSVPATMNLTEDYWENPLLPPDRWLQISENIGLHSGYLFDYGVGGNNRKDSINNAFFLYTSRKCYPHGIDSAVATTAGKNYSAVVWRSYLDVSKINTNGVISINVFEYDGKCYIYGDFNAVGMYEIEIPNAFVGREITVFEKSDNVTLLTSLATRKILVEVKTANPLYGYIVAKIGE